MSILYNDSKCHHARIQTYNFYIKLEILNVLWANIVNDVHICTFHQVDRLVPVAGKEQMQSFDHVFYGHTRKNLNDGHIWFSIFARPAGSRFTRCQRVACCMMLLWLEMLVNIMWYKVVPPAPASNALSVGPFSLSPAQVSSIQNMVLSLKFKRILMIIIRLYATI